MVTKIVEVHHKNVPVVKEPIVQKYPDVFVPVLGGAAVSKVTKLADGLMFRDNQGKNISELTRQVNEHTVLYWMRYHYDLLGDPDMVGLCHYRRHFDVDYHNLDPSKIYALRNNVVFVGDYRPVAGTVHSLYATFISPSLLNRILCHYLRVFPEYEQDLNRTLESTRFYGKNLTIMSRAEFFSYSDYLLHCYRMLYSKEVIDEVNQMFDPPNYFHWLYHLNRAKSYLCELFTSVYLTHRHRLSHNVVPTPLTKESFIDDKVPKSSK